jgi:hypothetical protein
MDMEVEAKKLIPLVYRDLARPGVRRLGQTLASVVSTALRPADGVLWTVNQAFDWVSEAASRRLEYRAVAKARIITPPAIIEGRVLQGLQVSGPSDEPQLRNMFAALLATAMDEETADRVHPAMVTTLSQMLPDEARFLSVIAPRRVVVINASNLERDWLRYGSWSYHFYDDIRLAAVTYNNYWEFLESLKHLGLIEFSVPYRADWEREAIHLPECASVFDRWREFAFRHWDEGGRERTDEFYKGLHDMFEAHCCRITRWGQDFAAACAAEEFYSADGYVMPEWAT